MSKAVVDIALRAIDEDQLWWDRAWNWVSGKKGPEHRVPGRQSLLWPQENPAHYIDKSDPNYDPSGSLYNPPLILDPIGTAQIKQAKPVAKLLRKVMQKEKSLWGPKPQFDIIPYVKRNKALEVGLKKAVTKDRLATGLYDDSPEALAKNEIKQKISNAFRAKTYKNIDKINELKQQQIFSDVIRGPWYHGRGTQPKHELYLPEGEIAIRDYGESRFKTGNVGEPWGQSLTMNPRLFRGGTFAKHGEEEYKALQAKQRDLGSRKYLAQKALENLEDKVAGDLVEVVEYGIEKTKLEQKIFDLESQLNKVTEEINDPEFMRVFPKFGGVPEEKVLPLYLPKGEKVVQKAYVESVKDLLRKHKPEEESIRTRSDFEHFLGKNRLRLEFNQMISNKLQDQGYSFLLHSPHRYDEYEMRALNPRRVIPLDKRRKADPTIARMIGEEGAVADAQAKLDQINRVGYQGTVKKAVQWKNLTDDKPRMRQSFQKLNMENILRKVGQSPEDREQEMMLFKGLGKGLTEGNIEEKVHDQLLYIKDEIDSLSFSLGGANKEQNSMLINKLKSLKLSSDILKKHLMNYDSAGKLEEVKYLVNQFNDIKEQTKSVLNPIELKDDLFGDEGIIELGDPIQEAKAKPHADVYYQDHYGASTPWDYGVDEFLDIDPLFYTKSEYLKDSKEFLEEIVKPDINLTQEEKAELATYVHEFIQKMADPEHLILGHAMANNLAGLVQKFKEYF